MRKNLQPQLWSKTITVINVDRSPQLIAVMAAETPEEKKTKNENYINEYHASLEVCQSEQAAIWYFMVSYKRPKMTVIIQKRKTRHG